MFPLFFPPGDFLLELLFQLVTEPVDFFHGRRAGSFEGHVPRLLDTLLQTLELLFESAAFQFPSLDRFPMPSLQACPTALGLVDLGIVLGLDFGTGLDPYCFFSFPDLVFEVMDSSAARFLQVVQFFGKRTNFLFEL